MLSKKHKLIGVAAAALCATAVFGVGYSTWSIASSTATLTAGVDVQAVTGSPFTAALATSGDGFAFGAPATMSTEGAWLTSDAANTEDLDVTVAVTFPVVPTLGNVYIKAAVDETHATAYTDIINSNLLVDVTDGYASTTAYSEFTTAGTAYEIDVAMGWGTALLAMNPYNYSNALGKDSVASSQTDTNAVRAQTYLNLLSGLNGATFTLTVSYSAT